VLPGTPLGSVLSDALIGAAAPCWPCIGRHTAFSGRLLHGVPAEAAQRPDAAAAAGTTAAGVNATAHRRAASGAERVGGSEGWDGPVTGPVRVTFVVSLRTRAALLGTALLPTRARSRLRSRLRAADDAAADSTADGDT